MTLNIRQLSTKVKFSPTALIPNPAHPLGQSQAYRQLKALGWACRDSEIHPTDRVPVFRLGGAAIRRQRTGNGWIVDVAGGEIKRQGDLARITAEAVALDTAAAEPAPDDGPQTMAESIADLLGQDYRAERTRLAAETRRRLPTNEESQRALEFALNPGRANRAMPSRAEFKVNYGGGR